MQDKLKFLSVSLSLQGQHGRKVELQKDHNSWESFEKELFKVFGFDDAMEMSHYDFDSG